MDNAEAEASPLVLDTDRPSSAADIIYSKYLAAQFAIERILGVPAGTFQFTNLATIQAWLA